MDKRYYVEPLIEVIHIEAEAGFVVSQVDSSGYPGEEPDYNDYGNF